MEVEIELKYLDNVFRRVSKDTDLSMIDISKLFFIRILSYIDFLNTKNLTESDFLQFQHSLPNGHRQTLEVSTIVLQSIKFAYLETIEKDQNKINEVS